MMQNGHKGEANGNCKNIDSNNAQPQSEGRYGGEDAGVQWTLWQLCDTSLPTGGFAHSSGLEAAAAQGIVRAKNVGSLHRFVRGALANASHVQLPLLREAFLARTLEAWVKLDAVAHACITAEPARRASLAQGAGLLRAVQAMFPLGDEFGVIMREFRALLRNGTALQGDENATLGDTKTAATGVARGHHAPALGVACCALGVPEGRAARAYMFMVARDILSAATRLSLIGPLEAGSMLTSLSDYVETLVCMGEEGTESGASPFTAEKSTSTAVSASHGGSRVGDRVCQVDPVQEIVQGLHDRLYSRMFNS